MTATLLAVVAALAVALLAVPPTIRLAVSRNLVDMPDECRRIHLRAVPRLGGVAVLLGCGAGLAVLALGGQISSLPASSARSLLGLCAGTILMFVVGLVDDLRGISPPQKFVGQLAAAGVAVMAGFRLEVVMLTPGLELSLGWASVPLTILWLVGVTNAFNLVDGLDGLAAGVALVALGTTAVSATVLGHPFILALALVLAASVLGFLRHNVSPARIFLGDVGSLSVGFALAYLTVQGARAPSGAVFLAVPLFGIAFPLLDTATAMLRRWLRGVPLSSADGRHVHHQLVSLGLTHSRAVVVLSMFAAGLSLLGLSISFAPPALTVTLAVLGGAVLVLIAVHGTKFLQYHELIEAQASFASGLRKARSVIRDRIHARDLEFRLRRSNSLAEIEGLLQQYNSIFGFEGMVLCRAVDSPYDHLRAPRGTRLLRMDRPVCLLDDDAGDELVLRVWWHEDARPHPIYAERIVRLVAPALEYALGTLGPQVADQFAASVPFEAVAAHQRLRRPANAAIR